MILIRPIMCMGVNDDAIFIKFDSLVQRIFLKKLSYYAAGFNVNLQKSTVLARSPCQGGVQLKP